MALMYVYDYLHEGRVVHFYAAERRAADKQFEEAFGTAPLDKQFITRTRW